MERPAEVCQREGDLEKKAEGWNREVSASHTRYESDKPAERTKRHHQWELKYSYQHEVHQTDTEGFEPSDAGRLPKGVPTRYWAGRSQSLTEIAQTTRQFKKTEDELAQRRQQLMNEIRHNDLLTQRVREDKQMWKRSLEARVSGQPFALTTQKQKSIPPLYKAKAARLDNPPMQVVPRITSHTATDS